MTMEEAKRRLLNIERSLPNTFRTKEDVRNFEALEMAIKALEQEPILDKIELKCDRINSLASVLPYTAHREIQELLCEIMDLCKAESEARNETDSQ